jgi:hypothetical protein
MPDASTPLNEDNVAEALQAIKDARKLLEYGWLTDRDGKLTAQCTGAITKCRASKET